MLTKKEAASYLMDKIERIEEFEEKLGIKYESISVNVKYYEDMEEPWVIEVVGDIVKHENMNLLKFLDDTIDTIVNLYDSENRIIETESYLILVRDFMGLDTFSIYFDDISSIEEIEKIRIYPKL